MADKSDNAQIAAVLSYFLVGIIWYFVDENIKKSSFVKYHVKQAIVLLVAGSIFSFVLGQIAVRVPLIGFILLLLNLVPLALGVIGILNALNMQEKPLPLIGQYGEKLNF